MKRLQERKNANRPEIITQKFNYKFSFEMENYFFNVLREFFHSLH